MSSNIGRALVDLLVLSATIYRFDNTTGSAGSLFSRSVAISMARSTLLMKNRVHDLLLKAHFRVCDLMRPGRYCAGAGNNYRTPPRGGIGGAGGAGGIWGSGVSEEQKPNGVCSSPHALGRNFIVRLIRSSSTSFNHFDFG